MITQQHVLGGVTGVAIWHTIQFVWSFLKENGGINGVFNILRHGQPAIRS